MKRVLSIDVLRGLSLLIFLLQLPVISLCRNIGAPWCQTVILQYDHSYWDRFTFADYFMPLFLFLVGVSMPFSFRKYTEGIWKKIVKRVIILWILGIICFGNLLALNLHSIYLYSNTLQAIAAGYFFTAIIIRNSNFRWWIFWFVALLILYWIPFQFVGNMEKRTNFAELCEHFVLGRFAYGTRWIDGAWVPNRHYHFTWVWSTVSFTAVILIGAIAGRILLKWQNNYRRIVAILVSSGIFCILAGEVWAQYFPMIRKIWTSSVVLYSSGISLVLLGLLYYWVDVKGRTMGTTWLRIMGSNSILVYLLGELIDFRSVVHSLTFGLERFFHGYYETWLIFANVIIIYCIALYCYKRKIFLKI